MKELNHELSEIKEQCKEFDRINKQLLIENETLNDRSIIVGQHPSFENQTSTELRLLSVPHHHKLSTIPLISENHHTQIDKEIQTEPLHQLWSTVSY